MQIEEYRIEELGSEEMANLAADGNAAMLIERLGLTGQKALVNSTTGTRCPFRRMTNIEDMVFRELFPEITEISKFDSEIIPVRVLELAGEAMDSGKFLKLEVWHSQTRKDDPVLVGVVGKMAPQTWDANYVTREASYLIARWGKALLPFDQLQSEAITTWEAIQRSELAKEIDNATLKLKRLADTAKARFFSGRGE